MAYAYHARTQYPSLQPTHQPNGHHLPNGHHEFDNHRTPTPSGSRRYGLRIDDAPQVQVQDFQRYREDDGRRSDQTIGRGRTNTAPSQRSPSSLSVDKVGAPPIPDLHQREIHIPTRTSSRHGLRRSHSREVNSSMNSTPVSRNLSPRKISPSSSVRTYETHATSVRSNLPALQTQGPLDEEDQLEPLMEDDPRSFDLIAPAERGHHKIFSLEGRSEQLFSREHLQIIFSEPSMLLRFTAFLSAQRPQSVPVLVYFLDTTKALKAINYANAIAEGLEPIKGLEFTSLPARSTVNSVLEDKAKQAFDVLVRDDLPAYIADMYTQVVSLSITRRITGTLAPHLREASEGLAEVFCLTDCSRPDNPIIFASEGMYPRRDGQPFMNLLMIAPLCDSRGKIRYFIGAQVDVSGMVKECTDLESLQLLVEQQNSLSFDDSNGEHGRRKDEFQELSEMLNVGELDTVRRHGGMMHKEVQDDDEDTSSTKHWHRPRLLLKEPSLDAHKTLNLSAKISGKLNGVYQNYLLIRPYPSLRILFASPTLRVPGILQSPFMNKIGGSTRVRDDLTEALAEGRGVTAKVRWISKADSEEGRNRWIHCTPLMGSNSQIGVWMVVIVDEESPSKRWKLAPPVASNIGKGGPKKEERESEYFPELNTQPSIESMAQHRTYNRHIVEEVGTPVKGSFELNIS
ncbi:MAG: hypothetical protein M1812_000090 [Candelaria pacifica]|nr:MAG: hypothetical protein M1812_000090 [Candelaria pacifica]